MPTRENLSVRTAQACDGSLLKSNDTGIHTELDERKDFSRNVNLYLALIHHPVVNKNGEVIASAITNLDLHDISRAARTYGVRRFFTVTPLVDQKVLAERIVSHWVDGYGARYNPMRGEALGLIRIRDSLEAVVENIHSREGAVPKIIATSAVAKSGQIGYAGCREMIKNGTPCLILFGTAWGLSEDLFEKADFTLKPIAGFDGYNHLSVRSAAAIILDRLVGCMAKA